MLKSRRVLPRCLAASSETWNHLGCKKWPPYWPKIEHAKMNTVLSKRLAILIMKEVKKNMKQVR